LDVQKIFIKDERQGPTASFKDRQAAVTIAASKKLGLPKWLQLLLEMWLYHILLIVPVPGLNYGFCYQSGSGGQNA